jgi:flagellar M-ring protein FliF
MNEFFKKIMAKVTGVWAGLSTPRKAILAVSVIVIIAVIGALFKVSSTPSLVNVLNGPVRDEAMLDKIMARFDQENIKAYVNNGFVQVADEQTARRMRTILVSENMIPSGIDPWQIFDRERWTTTDFERNVNFRRAQTTMIINHLKAIDDIDDVSLVVEWPKDRLFQDEQNPVTAGVVITPKPGSDIYSNRKKIEGIQKLLQFAIEGLTEEHITITSKSGIRLNDFENMLDFDKHELTRLENKHIREIESDYRKIILQSLKSTYSDDRVRDLNIKFEKDMSRKTVDTKENFPFVLKERTPGLPYDDSRIERSVTVGETETSTTWEGTGYNPEGPAGVEGQTPPAFKDMQNLSGKMVQVTRTHNEEINQRNTHEEKSPQIDRVTVSVNIDGKWKKKYDEKGNPVILSDNSIEREYTPIPEDELRKAEMLIRDAIGYNPARGDSVTVQNIQFDRTEQFRSEDADYFRKKQMQTTVIVFISGLTLLLIGFIIFRMISREMERRRRIAEEERARREQMLRESAMAEAEQEGMDVSISLEERTRMELMENAINMAKEHPEDAAQLIRTWLLEE